MKLEQFKEQNKKKKVLIIFSVLIVLLLTGLFLYRSFAFFESQKNYDAIKGIVSYSPSDITLTSYVDGTISKNFPSKDDKYAVEKVECSNGASGTWNYTNWEVNIQNLTNTKTKCKVDFVTKYKESILNGTDPIISENLIPVTISNDGTVKKADMKSEWYNYSNKQWANAVILEDETANYQNGEVIPESEIESYFVWIPKYKYRLWDLGNYTTLTAFDYNKKNTIDIIFGTDSTMDTNNDCKTPNKSGETGNCSVGKYMTHPAFVSFNSNGMWVGKFEAGYKGALKSSDAEVVQIDFNKIQIKPNVFSLHGLRGVAYSFLGAYQYQRNLDSHLLKNTEYGAIAYLTHSKYGINNEVRINNNSDYITGYASVLVPDCGIYSTLKCNEVSNSNEVTQPYNTETGYLASTTGNITGIYDLSGGVGESTMGVLLKNDLPTTGEDENSNSGFNGPYSFVDGMKTDGFDFPGNKYVDYYLYNRSVTNYAIRILGDATGEMGPFAGESQFSKRNSWYQSFTDIVQHDNSWFIRGGFYNWGLDGGIYQTATSNGERGSVRIILSP